MSVPIVLLHGYTDSANSFRLLRERLPDWVEPHALTHRDHGDATEVAAYMDAAGLEQAVILGHSGGSYTAQRFAVDHPERTLGLVLIGAFHSVRGEAVVDELWDAVSAMKDPVDRAFAAEFQLAMMTRPVEPAFVEMVIAESQALPVAVWRKSLRALIDAPIPTGLGTITAPTLILWGDRDAAAARVQQDALVSAIPGARLVVYEGTGHSPHWEEPGRAAADIAAFVSSRGRSRPRPAVAR